MTRRIVPQVMPAGLLAPLIFLSVLSVGNPLAAQAQGRADVAIVDNAFEPRSILVGAGDTVAWTNAGAGPHTVTADDGSVDSGPLVPGASFSLPFPDMGLFTYHCAIHPQMIGAVTVTAAANQAGGSAASRVPRTGVGTAARSAALPLALVLTAASGSMAVLVRIRAR
jgi:plastocyanin